MLRHEFVQRMNRFAKKINAMDLALLFPVFVSSCWFRFSPLLFTTIAKLKLRLYGCTFDKGLGVTGRVLVRSRYRHKIILGKNVRFISHHWGNMVGLTSPILLESIEGGVISIGDFSGGSSIVISSRKEVRIGKHVKLGGNVRIYDHDYHSLNHLERRSSNTDGPNCKSAAVYIEDDVFVGTNSLILKGVTIGARSIIGAGSVVTGNVPCDEIWAGNPARKIKSLEIQREGIQG